MNDLLVDPLFSVETPTDIRHLSLPGLLAALGEDQVLSYPELRRHQQDPFHVFLCQLAAASLARAGETSPVQPEAFWQMALLELADGEASAWQLVVEDPTLPAFMQPPAPSKADFEAAYTPKKGERPKASTPDELDVLVTSKDHDVKAARASAEAAELWVFALITLQTTTPYLGSGQQGVIRINSYSRAIVDLVTDPSPCPRFRESIAVLIQHRPGLLRGLWQYKNDGLVLTWLPVWDRTTSLSLAQLDPFFVEAPRAIRLVTVDQGLEVWNASTEKRIVGTKRGDTGDFWTVLKLSQDGVSALNPNKGFDPKLLTDLLFDDMAYRLTVLQKPRDPTVPTFFCASVLARGHTPPTEGFHAVAIPIPKPVRLALFSGGQDKESLGKLAKELLRDASVLDKDCLRPALFALCKGGISEKQAVKNKKKIADSVWVAAIAADFALAWQDSYFPLLWRGADPGADLRALRGEWVRSLAVRACDALRRAEQRAPIPSSRKLRAAVRAQSLLEAMFHTKGFDEFLKETVHVDSDN